MGNLVQKVARSARAPPRAAWARKEDVLCCLTKQSIEHFWQHRPLYFFRGLDVSNGGNVAAPGARWAKFQAYTLPPALSAKKMSGRRVAAERAVY